MLKGKQVEIYAYADDLAIVINNNDEIKQIKKIFEVWKEKYNLAVYRIRKEQRRQTKKTRNTITNGE